VTTVVPRPGDVNPRTCGRWREISLSESVRTQYCTQQQRKSLDGFHSLVSFKSWIIGLPRLAGPRSGKLSRGARRRLPTGGVSFFLKVGGCKIRLGQIDRIVNG